MPTDVSAGPSGSPSARRDGTSIARPAVRLDGITKTYPSAPAPAIRGVSFACAAGEIFTLLGPSGCGKTTTLRVAAGLEVPDAGDVYFGERAVLLTSRGINVPPHKRPIGMVFQSGAVWPHMTVRENVAFPLKVRGAKRSRIDASVERVLELVGLAGLENRPAPLLSGGQAQRVALARALITEPDVLLLDEPFNSLDAKLRDQLRLDIKDLKRRLEIAILFVTHDQVEALTLSDRIAVMKDGIVEQQGSPQQLYEQPASEFVRDFVGRTVLLRGTLRCKQESGLVGVAISGSPNSVVWARHWGNGELDTVDELCISVRPEDIDVVPAGDDQPRGGIIGVVRAALYTGERVEYEIEVEGQGTLHLHGKRQDAISERQVVVLNVRPNGHSVWPTT